ncbi:MAG: HAMP domain-containing histidine kinase [Bryobacteraceae bacterium]|nr:HAMP domain-containing histidine kinase [Bryobacteraceae bacterium]MDW8376663.1 HAMP domain-containing sensor histidine kinase [Bryobacterales bacterium]
MARMFPRIVAAQRLQVWLLVAALTALILTGALVVDLTRNLRTVVISDTNRNLATAVQELQQAAAAQRSLPDDFERLDQILKPLGYEVLRSHADIEGGYVWRGQVVGHTFPTYTELGSTLMQPAVENNEVMLALAESRQKGGRVIHRVRQDDSDLVLVAAAAGADGRPAAWCLRRIINFSDTSELGRRLLLVAVMGVALLSVVTVLTLSFQLQRGFAQIQRGLARLETDPSYRLPDQNHELRPIVQAINTMAQRRQVLEGELRREDRLRVMGRVVAGIAHEIKNPLNSLRLMVRALARRLESEPAAQESTALITAEIDRLDALLQSLLVFRQDDSRRPRRQALQPILERSLALVRPHACERQIELAVEGDAHCSVYVDGDYLQQALINVLLNAIDASETQGKVNLRIEQEPQEVKISVKDSGPGLTPEQQERMFEAFYTTKQAGVGLGLAITRTLLEKMGGSIEAQSAKPGAVFTLRVPAAQPA